MNNADCWGCSAAKEDPRTGRYVADCGECQARALAQSPEFFTASARMMMTASYRAALARVAGTDDPKACEALHARVKAWSRILATYPLPMPEKRSHGAADGLGGRAGVTGEAQK